MSASDRASAWRDRARAARGVGDDPTADYCEAVAADYDNECDWIHSPEFERRVRESIARLESARALPARCEACDG